MTKTSTVAISVGCPSGVGPEVAVDAAAHERRARCVLVGDASVLAAAARVRHVAARRLVRVSNARDARRLRPGEVGVWTAATQLATMSTPGRPSAEDGAAQLAWIDEATDLVTSGVADALVTAPVSKLAIATSGAPNSAGFRGHTEHLAERLDASTVVMAFAITRPRPKPSVLATALVTTHVSLAEVPDLVSADAVAEAAIELARLVKKLGVRRPRIVVAALNPHAGEGGLLGAEERTRIGPGVVRARAELAAAQEAATIDGPLGAETAFRRAKDGAYDGVVAMYHDQATIPMKLLGFGDAVNVTLGLPIVRTSVDHGTAYDLAGLGKADARGMREAVALATRLAR